ncbi:MAG: hypothetical protein ABI629_06275 [bacterium]
MGLARVTPGALRAMLFVVASLAFVPSSGEAGEALSTPDDGVEVRIDTVLASNSGKTFDPALARLKRPFRGLFPYSSYRLIQGERRVMQWRHEEQFLLPGGRYLVVVPRGVQGDRVSLGVMLIQGSRPLVNTVLTLKNRGVFLVGGPRYGDGVLIIAIGARTRRPALPIQTSGGTE